MAGKELEAANLIVRRRTFSDSFPARIA